MSEILFWSDEVMIVFFVYFVYLSYLGSIYYSVIGGLIFEE